MIYFKLFFHIVFYDLRLVVNQWLSDEGARVWMD